MEVIAMRRRGNDYDGALSLVIMFLLLMFALPIIGFRQVGKGEAINVAWGIFLIVIGVGFWIWLVCAA